MDCVTIIFLAVISLISIFLLYKWLFASWDDWASKGIPSVPNAIPIVGNTLSVFRLQENFATFCKRIYDANRGKSMIGFYKMKSPTLMVMDLELVKTVLQSNFKYFPHNESSLDIEADPLFARDIFFVREPKWKESRAHFASAFSSKRLKHAVQAMSATCKKMENYLKTKMSDKDCYELESKLLFSRYTTDVAAGTVLSIEGNSFVDDYRGTLLECNKLTMDPTTMKGLSHNVIYFFPALGKLLMNSFVPPYVDKYFRRLLQDVEKSRQNSSEARNDVFQQMLDLGKDKKISRDEVLSHTYSFFLESYETSSLTLSFMMYELARHPNVQNELRGEIETVLEKYKGEITYEGINELVYTEQVVYETLRFYPPVGALTKVCAAKYRLEGSDGLSLEVEPDTTVVIPVIGLHMDPNIWENPQEFNPARFQKGNDGGRHKFAFLAFGEGPRACPGTRIAIMQIKAAAATIVRNYRIALSPKIEQPLRMDPHYFMTTALGGIWIKLHPLRNH